jgi:hypothetical protein
MRLKETAVMAKTKKKVVKKEEGKKGIQCHSIVYIKNNDALQIRGFIGTRELPNRKVVVYAANPYQTVGRPDCAPFLHVDYDYGKTFDVGRILQARLVRDEHGEIVICAPAEQDDRCLLAIDLIGDPDGLNFATGFPDSARNHIEQLEKHFICVRESCGSENWIPIDRNSSKIAGTLVLAYAISGNGIESVILLIKPGETIRIECSFYPFNYSTASSHYRYVTWHNERHDEQIKMSSTDEIVANRLARESAEAEKKADAEARAAFKVDLRKCKDI